jgi:hypothetical protein
MLAVYTLRDDLAMSASKFILCAIACLSVPFGFTQPSSAEAPALVVDNSPQQIPDGEIRAQLRGVTTITTSPKFLESGPYGVTVPKDIVVTAVNDSPEVKQKLGLPTDSSEITFTGIMDAAQSAKGMKLIDWQPYKKKIIGVYCGVPKEQMKAFSWQDLSCDTSAEYNSEAVLKLVLKGGLDTRNTISSDVKGRQVQFVAVQPTYASVLLSSNRSADMFKKVFEEQGPNSGDSLALQINYLVVHSTTDNTIRSVAFLDDKFVTFGTPLISTSTEAHLNVPQEISRDFDVYLIQLAMTWRQLPSVDLTELGFSVKVPSDTLALALMPLRYGITVEEKTGTHPAPEVELEGVKVKLGEVYGRDISFSYLKPTIQAYGLQESQFSWTMRDQAIQPGAERFLCVVGVPKHSKELALVMSAFVRKTSSMFSAGGIESTDTKMTKIHLK